MNMSKYDKLCSFAIFCYTEDWEQHPYSKKYEGVDITDAIEKCVKELGKDEHLMPKDDGTPWYYEVENYSKAK